MFQSYLQGYFVDIKLFFRHSHIQSPVQLSLLTAVEIGTVKPVIAYLTLYINVKNLFVITL